jgi:hypothetical protein
MDRLDFSSKEWRHDRRRAALPQRFSVPRGIVGYSESPTALEGIRNSKAANRKGDGICPYVLTADGRHNIRNRGEGTVPRKLYATTAAKSECIRRPTSPPYNHPALAPTAVPG